MLERSLLVEYELYIETHHTKKRRKRLGSLTTDFQKISDGNKEKLNVVSKAFSLGNIVSPHENAWICPLKKTKSLMINQPLVLYVNRRPIFTNRGVLKMALAALVHKETGRPMWFEHPPLNNAFFLIDPQI